MSDMVRQRMLGQAGGVSTFGVWSCAYPMTLQGQASAQAWPSNNLAIAVPVRVPSLLAVDQIAIGTGTLTTGNFSAGIYDAAFNLKATTGAQARNVASSEIITTITRLWLPPGLYYLALSSDSTATFIATLPSGTAPVPTEKCRLCGLVQMASAHPLPTTFTPAAYTGTIIPAVGAILA